MKQVPSSLLHITQALANGGTEKSKIEEIIRHHKDGLERDFLMEYQSALSLWAEHQQDMKKKVIVTLDGRDTAGKGSNIRRVTEQFNHTKHNTTAFPGIPTTEERNKDNWFKRYERFFPQEGKVRFFDRSWYNRAGVEAAMGFCTQEEYEWFMSHVNDFEEDRIIDLGYDFIKVYLSISKETQKKRLKIREKPRKAWKSSPIDAQAQEKWSYYTLAKKKILEFSDSNHAPWIVLDSNEKHLSTVELIKAIITTSHEVKKMVENDLSIDLSPDMNIRRSASQELKRMESVGDIPTSKSVFKFYTS